MITFTWDWTLFVNFVVAVVLPLLVGLVTTRVTDSGTKAVLLALLNLATAGLVELGKAIAGGASFDVGLWLLTALGQYVVSVALHFGLWRPSGATDAAVDAGRTAEPVAPGEGDPLG